MKKLLIVIMLLLIGSCQLPQEAIIPVQQATVKDWNHHSFWYHPWGKSGVHKGIDIFANHGTPVLASASGLVIYTGNLRMGGNAIAVLDRKWRLHYYAHLATIETKSLYWASRGKVIGLVGDSGNAAGKPPHLHYSIITLIPYPWRWSTEPQGWKKMFFIDPTEVLAD